MKTSIPLKIACCALLWAAASVQAATITLQPASIAVGPGSNVTFTVAATASSGTLTNQWYGPGGTAISGATNLSVTISNVSSANGGNYYLTLTDGGGSTNSATAVMTVCAVPTISSQPASVSVAAGSTNFLSVTGAGGALSYKWTRNTATDGLSTSNTCQIDTTSPGTATYKVVVSNLAGSVASSVATVTVIGPPAIKTQATNYTVALGTNYTFKVACTNTAGTFTWYFCTNTAAAGAKTNVLSAFTTNICTVANAQYADEGSYWLVLSNLAGVVTSSAAVLDVMKAPAFTVGIACASGDVSGNTNFVKKDSTVTFTITPTGDSLSYYWMKDAKVFSTIATNSFSFPATNSGKYSVMISNTVTKGITSSNIVLNVIPPPTISAQPAKQTIWSGANLTLSVKAAGTAPYTNLVYQWMLANGAISGATKASLTITNAGTNAAGSYTVVITNYGGSVTSSVAVITVNKDTNGPTITVIAPAKALTNATYTLKGTAKDNVLVTNLTYTLNGGTSIAVVSDTNNWAKWSATNMTLNIGTNKVILTATDINGNPSTATNNLLYAPLVAATFTKAGNGAGTLSGTGNTNQMQWGQVYTLTATAGPRNLFAGWSGLSGIVCTNSTNSLSITFKVTNTVAGVANFATNKFFDSAGQYNGLFYDTNVTHLTAGSIQISVTTNLALSGTVLIGGQTFKAVTGQIAADGTASVNVKSNISLTFTMVGQQLTGTVTQVSASATNTSALLADRAGFSKTFPATNFSGAYTLVIPPAATGNAADGYGYGYVTVSTNGMVTLMGAAADGSALSQTVPISTNGDWPLFVPLYATKTNYGGELIGWLSLTNKVAAKGPKGDLCWINPGQWTNHSTIISSPYTPTTKASPKVLPNFVWGTLWFTGGGLTNDLGAWMFMSKSGAGFVYEDSTSIKFTAGIVSGKFVHNLTGKPVSYAGAVLQNTTNAYGYFALTNKLGTMQIDAAPAAALTEP